MHDSKSALMAAKTTSLYHCSFNQGTLGHFCDVVLLCICQIVEASEDNAAVRRHDLKQVCPRSNNCNYSIGIQETWSLSRFHCCSTKGSNLFVSGPLSSTKTMTTCKSWVEVKRFSLSLWGPFVFGDQNHSLPLAGIIWQHAASALCSQNDIAFTGNDLGIFIAFTDILANTPRYPIDRIDPWECSLSIIEAWRASTTLR